MDTKQHWFMISSRPSQSYYGGSCKLEMEDEEAQRYFKVASEEKLHLLTMQTAYGKDKTLISFCVNTYILCVTMYDIFIY